jgi:excisionase family DNA binding protein
LLYLFLLELFMKEKLLTPQEAAETLGLQISTLYRWSWARKIPSVKIGAALRFRETDIQDLISNGFRPRRDSSNG